MNLIMLLKSSHDLICIEYIYVFYVYVCQNYYISLSGGFPPLIVGPLCALYLNKALV